VEANAGTGKTHCLGSLVLRLIAQSRVDVRELAVVTFTDAAARELRERLRGRLQALVRRLETMVPDRKDAIVEALALAAPDDEARRALQRVVADALLRFDEATISTIHGFCRRALERLGLHAGTGEPEDPAPARTALLADLWRRRVVGGDEHEAAWVLGWCQEPFWLDAALREAHDVDVAALDPAPDPRALERLKASQREAHARGRDLGRSAALDEVLAVLRRAPLKRNAPFLQGRCQPLRECLLRWFEAGDPLAWPMPEVSALAPAVAAGFIRKGGPALPDNALTRWATAWHHDAQELHCARRVQFLHDALAFVREGMARRRAVTGVLTHDDVIADLHAALHGDAGDANAAALARRWRIGIVDEFQDTDARQYAIFRRLFRGGAGSALFLVGDPKQAIYRFRGGDVYAYRRAASDADQRWGLSANWRADAPLVDALNTVFGRPEVDRPFLVDFIRYAPSSVGHDRGDTAWSATAPLTIWNRPDPDKPAKEVMTAAAAAAVAAEVVALHTRARQEGIEPPSIAVLTATHDQGAVVADALRDARLPFSVAGRESVMASAVARDVLSLLRALGEGDSRAFRNARARTLFGLPLATLALACDDDASGWHLRDDLRRCWQAQGPLALLRRLLAEVAPRWLSEPEGMQRFADVLHIGELLEERRAGGQGPGAQAAWLAARRRSAVAEEPVPRDETPRAGAGAGAVHVLTVHASKGLQFDVVFAPFLWSRRASWRRGIVSPPVKYHDGDGVLRVDLGSPDWKQREGAQQGEEDAEVMRQAYVALTRAKHRAYTLWGRCTTADKSPLAHLFHPETSVGGRQPVLPDPLAMTRALDRVAAGSRATIQVRTLVHAGGRPRLAPAEVPELVARSFTRRLTVERRVLSFTAMVARGGAEDVTDRDAVAAVPIEDPAAGAGPIAAFPRGARVGECVHWVLEHMDFADWPGEAGRRVLEEACRRYRFGPTDAEVFAEWIGQACGAELLPGLRLRTLAARAQARELEFHFSLGGSQAALGAALALDPRYRRAAAELEHLPARLSGLMHGFMDLVLRHGDRWYVVDYKTNFLGGELADYAPVALARAARESDYDLQYLIYHVALHRHLRHRLGEAYVPERDLGGALYLFLRGLTDDGRAGVHHDRPPLAVIEALDLAFGRAESAP
jgi:exodeoxyribonuclease V beta subunit